MQPLAEKVHQGGATCNDDRPIQSLAKVDVALLDARCNHLVHAWVLESDQLGLEQNLWGLLLFATELDDVAVGQRIIVLVCFLFFVHVEVAVFLRVDWLDVAVLLLNLSHDLKLCGRVECVTSSSQQLHQVCSDITTS